MSAIPISTIDRTKADWTPQRDAYLVELLIEQQNAGNRSDTGWKKEAWKYMVDAFNKRFGIENNVQQLKSRIAQLKKQYNIVRQLINQSGFSWNGILNVVVADDDVWDCYLMSHPEAKPFRKAGLPLFEDLGTLFDGAECRPLLGVHLESENGRSTPGPLRTPCHSTAAMPFSAEDSDEVTLSSEQEIQLDPRCHKRGASSLKMSGKRRRVGTGNRIASALEGIVAASLRLAESAQTPVTNNEKFTYKKCLEELQLIEGLDDNIFMRAVTVLRDEKNAIAFLTLKGPRRLSWLLLQCDIFTQSSLKRINYPFDGSQCEQGPRIKQVADITQPYLEIF